MGGQAVATVRIAGSHNEHIRGNSLEITREPGREMRVLQIIMTSCSVIILEIKTYKGSDTTRAP